MDKKRTKLVLVAAGLLALLVILPGVSSARVSFGISVGTPFVHHHPGFYPGWYPYHHAYPYYGWYPHRRWHSSTDLGIWIGDCYPVVIDPPVIVHREVVTKTQVHDHQTPPDPQTAEQIERLRLKKSELLDALRIGDKERRIQAIRDLTEFTCDDAVRVAMEKILLSDPDPDLRKEVAKSFGRTENSKLVSSLQEAKNADSDKEVRQAAYRSIILIKGY